MPHFRRAIFRTLAQVILRIPVRCKVGHSISAATDLSVAMSALARPALRQNSMFKAGTLTSRPTGIFVVAERRCSLILISMATVFAMRSMAVPMPGLKAGMESTSSYQPEEEPVHRGSSFRLLLAILAL